MSTTVTYKGDTLTTATNQTKVLETAGKYLEDDITITDVSSTATVVVTEEPDVNGGIIKNITAVDISDTTAVASDVAQGKYFYTAVGVKTSGTASGGDGSTWSWMGRNPVKILTLPNKHFTFRELGLDSVTYTTSTTNVYSSQSYEQSTVCDVTEYTYYLIQKVVVEHKYFSSSPKAAVNRAVMYAYYRISGNFDSAAALTTGVPDKTATSYASRCAIRYCNSSGSKNTTGSNYGFYCSTAGVPSFSSLSSTTTTMTWKTPTLYFKGTGGIMSSEALSLLDFDESYVDITSELWCVDQGTDDVTNLTHGMIELWQDE